MGDVLAKHKKVELIIGKHVDLREVELSDAEFILSLRTDELKSKFLHKTENDLQKQIEYLKNYKTLDNEYYFIIENKKGNPLGTVRLYNLKENQCTGGSWIMKSSSTVQEVIEGDLLLQHFVFDILNLENNYFDVRKGNNKVIKFHKMKGAKEINQDEKNFYFVLNKRDFEKSKDFFSNLL